jgi:hypothetical protein
MIARRAVTTIALLFLSAMVWAADQKLDNFIVYGEGFAFSLKEPAGWVGDIRRASEFGANVILYPAKANLNAQAVPIVRVVVSSKADEDTAADLAHDMESYRSEFSEAKFKDIAVSHASYRTFAKLFYVPGKFYEYVTYVNPGADSSNLLSVSLNKQRTEATAAELSAYGQVIQSLQLLAPKNTSSHGSSREKATSRP